MLRTSKFTNESISRKMINSRALVRLFLFYKTFVEKVKLILAKGIDKGNLMWYN